MRQWRSQRAEDGRTGGPSSPGLPSLACITVVRDESEMLPRWIAHYGAQVGVEALLVVDDNSSDGSTDRLPCPVLRIPPMGDRPFEPARMGLVNGLAAGLLHAYDAVLFTDADEFVVADPARFEGLRHLLAERRSDVLGVTALNVVHDLEREGPLDPRRPVLDQRRAAKFVPIMCKPSLKRVPAAWGHASHGVRTTYRVDPDLWMFHLKFADRDHLRRVADHRRAMVESDGRARSTSWSRGGEEMVAVLDQVNVDLGGPLQEFVPNPRRLEQVVREEPPGLHRASGRGQIQAMLHQPAVRIPARFAGLL